MRCACRRRRHDETNNKARALLPARMAQARAVLKEAEQRHHIAASTIIFNDLLLTCNCVAGYSSATAALSVIEEMHVSSAARTSCSL